MSRVRGSDRLGNRASLLLAAVLVSGCRGPAPLIQLDPDNARKVAADHARVVVVVPERKVVFREQLYKVLWNEFKATPYSFEGVWDPAPWLEGEIARALKERWAIEATPLRRGMDPAVHDATTKSAAEGLLAAWKERRGVDYFRSPADASVRRLRGEGAEYLFQTFLVGIVLNRQPLRENKLGVQVQARIVRLSDGEILWANGGSGSASVPDIESFADLEKNDLALLKQSFESAVASILRPDGNFLADLGPGAKD